MLFEYYWDAFTMLLIREWIGFERTRHTFVSFNSKDASFKNAEARITNAEASFNFAEAHINNDGAHIKNHGARINCKDACFKLKYEELPIG